MPRCLAVRLPQPWVVGIWCKRCSPIPLRNIVAINLRRKYGDECYFFNTPKAEVDFYIPEESTAIQVAYSMADQDTRKREVDALIALADYQDVQHLLIVTKDDEETLEEKGKVISVIPLWKWLMTM